MNVGCDLVWSQNITAVRLFFFGEEGKVRAKSMVKYYGLQKLGSKREVQWCAGHSDSVHVNPTPPYLCHFSTEMAEIWSPATAYQDVFAYKILAFYHMYFQSYKAFSGSHYIPTLYTSQ